MPLLINVIKLIKDSTVIKAYLAVELISPPSPLFPGFCMGWLKLRLDAFLLSMLYVLLLVDSEDKEIIESKGLADWLPSQKGKKFYKNCMTLNSRKWRSKKTWVLMIVIDWN